MLGWALKIDIYGEVKYHEIQDHFRYLEVDPTDDVGVDQMAKDFLKYTLGRTVFKNLENVVNLNLLQALENIDNGRKYN